MAVKMKPKTEQLQELKPIPKSKQHLKASTTPVHAGDIFLTEQQKGTVHLLATVMKQINDLDASALIKEKEGYRKALVSLCDQLPSNQPVTMVTDDATVVFSAAPDLRVIEDPNGLIGVLKAKIGYEGMMSLIKISIGDATKYLSEAELEPFLASKPGSRTLKSATLTNAD